MNYLILNSSFNNELGILDGKTAALLYFTLNKGIYPKQWIEDVVADFANEILTQINLNTSLLFGNGICGIGCVLNYLFRQNDIPQSSLYYLEETESYLFNAIYSGKVRNIGLKSGLVGIGTYFLSCYSEFEKRQNISFYQLKELLIAILDQLNNHWMDREHTAEQLFNPWDGWSTTLPFLRGINKLNLASIPVTKLSEAIEKKLLDLLADRASEDVYFQLNLIFNLITTKGHQNFPILILDKLFLRLSLESEELPIEHLAWSICKGQYLLKKNLSANCSSGLLSVIESFKRRVIDISLPEKFPYNPMTSGINQGMETGVGIVAITNISLLNKDFTWLKLFGY